MEYSHEQAVADRVNVDFDVYRIRTVISECGSTVNAGFWVDKRDRLTRRVRWEQLDQDQWLASSLSIVNLQSRNSPPPPGQRSFGRVSLIRLESTLGRGFASTRATYRQGGQLSVRHSCYRCV